MSPPAQQLPEPKDGKPWKSSEYAEDVSEALWSPSWQGSQLYLPHNSFYTHSLALTWFLF